MKIGKRYETRGRTLVRIRYERQLRSTFDGLEVDAGFVIDVRLYDKVEASWKWVASTYSPQPLSWAKDGAVRVAQHLAPSELIIFNKNGLISTDKRTYGADPRKTKG